MLAPQSDAGCAGIARARRRGLLGKFGGRGGVAAALPRAKPLVTKPRKKEFFPNR